MESLQFEPTEVLIFDLTSERTANATITIRNTGSEPVAFKVQTNAPRRYLVRPNNSVLDVGATIKVTVQVGPKGRLTILDRKGAMNDRFIIKSQPCPPSFLSLEKGSPAYEAELNRLLESLSSAPDSSLFNAQFLLPTPEDDDDAITAEEVVKPTEEVKVETVKKVEAEEEPAEATEKAEVKTDGVVASSETVVKPPVVEKEEEPVQEKKQEAAAVSAVVQSAPVVAEPVVQENEAPQASEEAVQAQTTEPSDPPSILQATTACVLANGYFISLKGLSVVKSVGDCTGVTSRVLGVEEAYHVTDKVKNGATVVIEKAIEINEKTKGLQNKALEYRIVSAGASIVKGLWGWGYKTFEVTRDKVLSQSSSASATGEDSAKATDGDSTEVGSKG